MRFEVLLHAAFVADEIWGDMLESSRARSVFAFWHVWRSYYSNANVEQLKDLLFNYDDQTTRFKRIKTRQNIGLIRVGSTGLEATLRPSPER